MITITESMAALIFTSLGNPQLNITPAMTYGDALMLLSSTPTGFTIHHILFNHERMAVELATGRQWLWALEDPNDEPQHAYLMDITALPASIYIAPHLFKNRYIDNPWHLFAQSHQFIDEDYDDGECLVGIATSDVYFHINKINVSERDEYNHSSKDWMSGVERVYYAHFHQYNPLQVGPYKTFFDCFVAAERAGWDFMMMNNLLPGANTPHFNKQPQE